MLTSLGSGSELTALSLLLATPLAADKFPLDKWLDRFPPWKFGNLLLNNEQKK